MISCSLVGMSKSCALLHMRHLHTWIFIQKTTTLTFNSGKTLIKCEISSHFTCPSFEKWLEKILLHKTSIIKLKFLNLPSICSVILSVLDPRKYDYLKDYSLDFEHAYMTTHLASWEACRYLFAALWQPDVIRTRTGVWRYVTHSRVIVLCGNEGEWHTQRICGSTWWWRSPKRLFSAGWSHMPHLEWEHDRNRKLFWWPDYFESLMAAKISWLRSARFFSCGAP